MLMAEKQKSKFHLYKASIETIHCFVFTDKGDCAIGKLVSSYPPKSRIFSNSSQLVCSAFDSAVENKKPNLLYFFDEYIKPPYEGRIIREVDVIDHLGGIDGLEDIVKSLQGGV